MGGRTARKSWSLNLIYREEVVVPALEQWHSFGVVALLAEYVHHHIQTPVFFECPEVNACQALGAPLTLERGKRIPTGEIISVLT